MSITVTTASQAWRTVCATQPKNAPGGSLTTSAVMMAASRIAVPVPSSWNAQSAA